FWRKIIVKRIDPEQNRLAGFVSQSPLLKPVSKTPFCEGRKLTLLCDPSHFLGYIGKRALQQSVYSSGPDGSDAAPHWKQPHGVGSSGPQSSLVVMRKKFRFICSHINLYGTILFASFARETQIESLLYSFFLPAIGDHVSLEHLKQQM